jgi:glucose/arabinose dehydrogenase
LDYYARRFDPGSPALLGMVFYQGRMFPSEYRGDAFVALHGSWNRTKRTGYKIIRIVLRMESRLAATTIYYRMDA